jgi:hypothetical protein
MNDVVISDMIAICHRNSGAAANSAQARAIQRHFKEDP